MSEETNCQPLDWTLSPSDAAARWPRSLPLICLWSTPPADASGARWSRWTILALHRPGRLAPGAPISTCAPDPSRDAAPDATPPFQGGHVGLIPYEWGISIEPAAGSRGPHPRDDRHWGDLPCWLDCPAAYVYDHLVGRWWTVGRPEARRALPDLARARTEPLGPWTLGQPTGLGERDRIQYERAVARTVEYIRAGDIFQANLAHRLTAAFEGDARAMFLELARRAGPWYGAYVELPAAPGEGGGGVGGRAVLSASPELFLELDGASRRAVTRPIKGTRAADLPRADAALEASEKDRAELTMIVDLMRNDLGRVCRVGSVRVAEPRAMERHGGEEGVWHGVATVEGVLREDADVQDLLRATFPGGSITGAPKIRAMQIIEELEPVRRGPYTGSIGYISDSGHACFNIAIRTIALTGAAATNPGATAWPEGQAAPPAPQHGLFTSATCDYGVGAGIVADSDPRAEWQETLAKAAPFLALCKGGTALRAVSAPTHAHAPARRPAASVGPRP